MPDLEVMPDLERIGGVTGWQRASTLAAGAEMPMSSHLYPEISAHLLAATPTAHWLEWVDWMAPLLAEPLQIVDGMAPVSPGTPKRSGGMRKFETPEVPSHINALLDCPIPPIGV